MLWMLFALFFLWLVFRELRNPVQEFFGFERSDPKPVFKGYLIVVFFLALSCSWPPIHHWYFQHFLTTIAQELSQNPSAKVHCNTLFDTLFDEELRVAGHADPKTGYIVIQYPKCFDLMDYVHHPYQASMNEIISLNILTHESMHARGEYNEAKTECQAVQRNFRTARLLGVPDYIAKQNALDYYNKYYLFRNDGYFSKKCAPDKAWDEHLYDSTWH